MICELLISNNWHVKFENLMPLSKRQGSSMFYYDLAHEIYEPHCRDRVRNGVCNGVFILLLLRTPIWHWEKHITWGNII